MKKILIILFTLGLTLGASAQKIGSAGARVGSIRGGGGGFKGGSTIVRPRVTVIAPYAPMYPYYGFGYGLGYSPFYNPFYYNRPIERPTELDLQIDDIKNEFKFKISTVRKDKNLSKDERKQQIRDLKHQREDAIIEAKKLYYKSNKQEDQE